MNAETWHAVVEALADRPELHEAWLDGLSYNSAATGSVLWRVATAERRLGHPLHWLESRELTEESSAVLVRLPDKRMRLRLAENPRLSLAAQTVLAEDPSAGVRFALSWLRGPEDRPSGPTADAVSEEFPPIPPLTRAEAETLVASPDDRVRSSAAWDARVLLDIALRLADDPADRVRLSLSMRHGLTDEQRTAIPYVIPPGYHEVPAWLKDLMDQPAAVAEHATSSHILIRRSVAMARHLPPATVELLAADEDFFVKLTLAEYCDDAPHELIVEMISTWDGLTWYSLLSRPNFLRPGMAADFARHPSDRVRWAALRDPAASTEIVEALSRDASDWVSRAASSDRRLPVERLQEALGAPVTAGGAARNPRLPEFVMHRLLDHAGVDPFSGNG